MKRTILISKQIESLYCPVNNTSGHLKTWRIKTSCIHTGHSSPFSFKELRTFQMLKQGTPKEALVYSFQLTETGEIFLSGYFYLLAVQLHRSFPKKKDPSVAMLLWKNSILQFFCNFTNFSSIHVLLCLSLS